VSTPLVADSHYYKVDVRAIRVGTRALTLGVALRHQLQTDTIIDSGTSIMYWPDSAHALFHAAFDLAAAGLRLGAARIIEGARCWPVGRAAAGIASFPTLSIEFAEAGLQEFSPLHYIFSHPSVGAATHYCNGVDTNGNSGLVFGALFMRHFRTTIDRAGARVYMVPDSCGDTDALAAGAPPPSPPPAILAPVPPSPAPAPVPPAPPMRNGTVLKTVLEPELAVLPTAVSTIGNSTDQHERAAIRPMRDANVGAPIANLIGHAMVVLLGCIAVGFGCYIAWRARVQRGLCCCGGRRGAAKGVGWAPRGPSMAETLADPSAGDSGLSDGADGSTATVETSGPRP
jgi:hypothetical protein